MTRKKRTWDFEDEADVLAVLGAELDIDADDLTIDDTGRGFSSFGVDTFWYVQTSGGSKGWVVARDADAVRELALATVKQDLEQEPEIFDQDWLTGHIDIDRLRRDLESDVQSSNWDYFNEMGDDDLISELQRSSLVEDPYLTEPEDEDDEPELSDRDGLIEALAEEKTKDEMKDPMAYLEEIYGEEATAKAIEIAGIDIAAAAKDAVDTDGPEHFLASYDGNTYELDQGWVYWRVD